MGESRGAKRGQELGEGIVTGRPAGTAGHMAQVNHLSASQERDHGYGKMLVHAADGAAAAP